MRLAGKTALVSGAGGGIGLAICRLFLSEGALVLGFERSSERLEALRAAAFTGLRVFDADVSSSASIAAALLDLPGEQPVDILVNNAAAYCEAALLDTHDDDWHTTHEATLGSVFRLSRAVLPLMLARGKGSIINISSVNALIASPGMAAYSSAKGAVHALTRQLAVEYGPRGIRCNALSPGLILSERETATRGALQSRIDAECYPIGRPGLPAEVASAALFLASDEASFITGVDLPVDGGLTALSPAALLSPKLRKRWGRPPISLSEDVL